MKQPRILLLIPAALVLGSVVILWKSRQSALMPALETRSNPSAMVARPHEESPEPQRPPSPPASRDSSPLEREPSDESAAVIREIVMGVDPMNMQDIEDAVRRLQALPAARVSAWMLTNLRTMGTQRPAERDRLIVVANRLQSRTDLPFWVNLLKRETPRYPEEASLRNPAHPTLESRFIDVEQLQAIRNIGLLARQDKAARRVLMDLILHPDPTSHRTLHREEAYVALKESDLNASLRVLKQLASDDELLQRL